MSKAQARAIKVLADTPEWQERSIEYVPIAELKPYKRNARTHSPEQVDQIVASMRRYGWLNPMLIDEDNRILAGHGRQMAATELTRQKVDGFDVGSCVRISGLSDADKRAITLLDNQLALNAGWDMELLKVEIGELDAEGFDLGLMGFEADFLDGLMADPGTDGLTDPDEVPETPEHPVTELGDVWVLGKHRLVCGDSTTVESVDKCLNGVKPLLMVTDPPYGVNYDANWRNEADRANGKPYGASAVGKVSNDDRADWSEAWALFPGDVAYVWHGERQLIEMGAQLRESGFEPRNLIVWSKPQLVIGRGNYHSQHETCWYAVKKSGKGHWAGDRKQSTLWQIDKPRKSETGHSTQKPVECMKRPIENNSAPGQPVYEPFSGSGTTIIAAEMTGRACHAIELAPEYVDVAIERWQAFTGLEATLEGTGKTFSEMKEARHATA